MHFKYILDPFWLHFDEPSSNWFFGGSEGQKAALAQAGARFYDFRPWKTWRDLDAGKLEIYLPAFEYY